MDRMLQRKPNNEFAGWRRRIPIRNAKDAVRNGHKDWRLTSIPEPQRLYLKHLDRHRQSYNNKNAPDIQSP